jgi:hypothetical protein
MARRKGTPTDLARGRKHVPTKVWYFPETKNPANKSREERCIEQPRSPNNAAVRKGVEWGKE